MVSADFNRDGIADLAVGDELGCDVQVLLGVDGGAFQPVTPFALPDCSRLWLAAGDLNGDGAADLAVATYQGSSDAVSVLLNDRNWPTTGFAAQVPYTVGSCPYAVVLGDFDGDGKPDLAVSRCGPYVDVLLNQGGGAFPSPALTPLYPVGGFPESAAVGDFNRDGRPDLAVPSESGALVSVLLNSGNWPDAGFSPYQPYPVGNQPFAVAVADFNGDGWPDLAVANDTDGTVSLLLNLGNGTFAAQRVFSVGGGPYSVVAGDFNADGKPDLAVANSLDNTLGVLMNVDGGAFAPEVLYGVGARPLSVTVADLNGDGALDLVTADSTGNTVSVLLGGCQ